MPQMILQKKYFKFICCIVALVFVAFLMSKFPYPKYIAPIGDRHPNFHEHLRAQTVWFMFLVVSGYSLSISLLLELFRQILVKKEFEAQKKQAELALYKAQINPHFFFNTMNTLYGLVISKSDKAESAFIKFTDLVKYSYSQIKADRIALRDELDYIMNYIELQRLRLNNHTTVNYHTVIDDDSMLVHPMLMITFVENAFKFGTSSNRDCAIDISVTLKDGILAFQCINDIMTHKDERNNNSIGLKNTRSRLDLIYPGKYNLSVRGENGKYNVQLEIRLI